jgi:hypothetical protein
MVMIEKKVRRYNILDSGSLCKLFRTDDIFYKSGDDFADISKMANFIENNLRNPSVFVMGLDPRYEAFVFSPMHNTTTFICHTAVRADKRDKTIACRLAECARYVFLHSTCEALIGFTPENNRVACMLNAFVGMKRIAVTEKTVRIDGKLVNEVIFQGTKEMFNARWGDLLGRV